MTEEEKRELEKQKAEQQAAQQANLTRAQQIAEDYNRGVEQTRAAGEQAVKNIQDATQRLIDTSNADQQAYRDEMAGHLTAWQNDMDASMGGVEAIIKAGEDRLQREREIAQAEYLASQRAAQGTGLAHLASSIANLIGVGGFNASNQTYTNPSLDWMRKADQDKQIARQRMDNLRDRQRQLQQHQLELKMNIANQAYGMQSALAGQDLEHRRGVANAQYQGDKEAGNIRLQTEQQAIQTGLAGTTARLNAEYQDENLAQNERHFNRQMSVTEKHYADQVKAQLARDGYQLDEKGNIVPIIDPTTGKPIGSRYDKSDQISFRVGAYGDMPQMDWSGSASWLVNTLLTSIDTIDDLPEDQETELKTLLRDNTKKAEEKAEMLKKYIGTSRKLRELISDDQVVRPRSDAASLDEYMEQQ